MNKDGKPEVDAAKPDALGAIGSVLGAVNPALGIATSVIGFLNGLSQAEPIQLNQNPLKLNFGGDIPLGQNAMQVQGNPGVDTNMRNIGGQPTQLTQGEVVTRNTPSSEAYVYSDAMSTAKSDKTFAARAKEIELRIAKIEKKLQRTPKDNEAKTALKHLKGQLEVLKQEQELAKSEMQKTLLEGVQAQGFFLGGDPIARIRQMISSYDDARASHQMFKLANSADAAPPLLRGLPQFKTHVVDDVMNAINQASTQPSSLGIPKINPIVNDPANQNYSFMDRSSLSPLSNLLPNIPTKARSLNENSKLSNVDLTARNKAANQNIADLIAREDAKRISSNLDKPLEELGTTKDRSKELNAANALASTRGDNLYTGAKTIEALGRFIQAAEPTKKYKRDTYNIDMPMLNVNEVLSQSQRNYKSAMDSISANSASVERALKSSLYANKQTADTTSLRELEKARQTVRSSTQQFNAQQKAQVDQMNDQAEANKSAMLTSALASLGTLGQVYQDQDNTATTNAISMSTLQQLSRYYGLDLDTLNQMIKDQNKNVSGNVTKYKGNGG